MQQKAGRTQGRNMLMFPLLGFLLVEAGQRAFLKPGVSLNSGFSAVVFHRKIELIGVEFFQNTKMKRINCFTS